MQEFWLRVVSVLVIVGVLFGYNTKLAERSKEEEIARLNVEVINAQNKSAALAAAASSADETQTDEAACGTYADGTYTGEANGFGGKITVEVLVENGGIKEITILSADGEDGAYLTMAEDVIPQIIEAQSAEVDSVSGATFSSVGIKEAVKQALEKAVA